MDESTAIAISKNDSGVGVNYLSSSFSGKSKLKIMLVAKIPTITANEERVPKPISDK